MTEKEIALQREKPEKKGDGQVGQGRSRRLCRRPKDKRGAVAAPP
jgi:hypothetical protein